MTPSNCLPKRRFTTSVLLSALLVMVATGAGGVHAASLAIEVLDAAGKPVANAVVYAEAEGAAASGAARAMPQVEIEQKGLKFSPLVTVIQTGSSVLFPNNDTVRHHIYSFSAPKAFEQKLYSGVPEPVLFDKSGTVVLGCNIHDRMLAYVVVVDTGFFAKTDATGKAKIEAPAGRYRLKTWHPDLAANDKPEQALVLAAADSKALVKLALKPKPIEADTRPLDYKY